MSTMIRQAILVGAVAGMTALTTAGQPFAGAAVAEPPSPHPTGTPFTPVPDPHLTVTVTPDKAQPGGTVNIKAMAPEGNVLTHASAHSPVLDSASLTTTDDVATGTAHVRADAKAGVYSVLVRGMTPHGLKLRGSAQFTVVVSTPKPPPTTPGPTTPAPTTPVVPKGGVGTGGGGTAGGADLALITAGSAIALLGVAAAVAAIRRRRTDVRA